MNQLMKTKSIVGAHACNPYNRPFEIDVARYNYVVELVGSRFPDIWLRLV